MIIFAFYGSRTDIERALMLSTPLLLPTTLDIVDVTTPLRFNLSKEGLVLPRGQTSKQHQLGFFNPIPPSRNTKPWLLT